MRMEHERLTAIRRTFRYSTEFARQVYELTETLQFNEDVPRQAIKAEEIFLGLKVKQLVLEDAKADGNLTEEEYLEYMKGTYIQLVKGLKLIREVKDEYIDAVECVNSVRFITEELTKLGLMGSKKKKK